MGPLFPEVPCLHEPPQLHVSAGMVQGRPGAAPGSPARAQLQLRRPLLLLLSMAAQLPPQMCCYVAAAAM